MSSHLHTVTELNHKAISHPGGERKLEGLAIMLWKQRVSGLVKRLLYTPASKNKGLRMKCIDSIRSPRPTVVRTRSQVESRPTGIIVA
jgi:hypothetical protein